MKSVAHSWSSPLAGFTFAVAAGTGILMFFEFEGPAIQNVHEWMGFAFAIAGAIHLVLHWRAFIAYFKQRQTLAVLAIVLLASLALALIGLGHPPEHEGWEHPGIASPVEKAP
jgi:hypothetical protein